MSTEENKAIVRRWFEEVVTRRGWIGPTITSRRTTLTMVPCPGKRPGWKEPSARGPCTLQYFPICAPGARTWPQTRDEVAVRWMAEGTQQGELLGIPPTGKHLRFGGMSIFRLAEGKIAEQWEEWDKLDLMRQLGAMPSPGRRTPKPRPGASDARWATAGATAGTG